MSTFALIVAAGRGTRLPGDVPKQYRVVGGKPLLWHTLRPFLGSGGVESTLVVINAGDMARYQAATEGLDLPPPVMGGARRQDSVRLGLEALAEMAGEDARVLIHDAARPFPSSGLISRVCSALDNHIAALPVLDVADTLKSGKDGLVTGTVPRTGIYRAQTPQGFHLPPLLAAHRRFIDEDVTDDAALMELAGHQIAMVEGEKNAFKVTNASDLARAESMLAAQMDIRVGSGFDVHRFDEGDHVMLCGVRVPHTQGLAGHSDADVGLHALTDAILGALGEGDIGQHFPPNNPKWRGADSSLFLKEAGARVTARGGRINHLDLTIIAEAPKVAPQRDAMIARVAEILQIQPSRVSIKATTTERLGFTGRKEGMAAQATATLALPGEAP